jgi:hypothetical protein
VQTQTPPGHSTTKFLQFLRTTLRIAFYAVFLLAIGIAVFLTIAPDLASQILELDIGTISLLLLSFLAGEALIERLGAFDVITKRLEDVDSRLTMLGELGSITKKLEAIDSQLIILDDIHRCAQNATREIIGYRGDKNQGFGEIREIIGSAERRIWISGITHKITIGDCIGDIRKKVRNGCEFRFLAIHPDRCAEVASFIGHNNEDTVLFDLKSSMTSLYALKEEVGKYKYPGKLDIRMINYRPGLTYLIADPDTLEGRMTVATLLKDKETPKCPMLFFRREYYPERFEVYLDDFESQWAAAEEFHPDIFPE